MSKINFKMPEINSTRKAYKLEEDVLKGFNTSVDNNQPIQALSYLALVIGKIVEHIEEEEDVEKAVITATKAVKSSKPEAAVVGE